MARSKLYQEQLKHFITSNHYNLFDAIAILKKMPHVKFDETVDLGMKLGIDPKQSDQIVRGSITLPHGTGKSVRVIVIASGPPADEAKSAGADAVGFDDLIDKIKAGWLEFDVMIATPAAMTKVRTLGKLLGPRGLMPNPKTGTVTDNTKAAVEAVKAGKIEFRADRTGCVHVIGGKLSFVETALVENCSAIISAVLRAKPPASKGNYMLSCTISSTMSPGIKLNFKEVTGN